MRLLPVKILVEKHGKWSDTSSKPQNLTEDEAASMQSPQATNYHIQHKINV